MEREPTQEGLGYTGEWQNSYRKYGILFLRARWLDVGTGRFFSPDPIIPNYQNPQNINRYLYALANPTNFTDSAGLQVQPPDDCEPGDICHTGTPGPYPPSPPPPVIIDAFDIWHTCEQYRATLELRAKSDQFVPPSQSELILAALCSGCYETPQPIPEITVDPLGKVIAGPIPVDSGIKGFWVGIWNMYEPREGGVGLPFVTAVQIFSRLKGWVAFYERGTRLDISDWYDTEGFRQAAHLVGDWSDDYTMYRSVFVRTTIGRRDGPFPLGEARGAGQGEGTLEYSLSYLYPEQADELAMRLAIHLGNEGIPLGNEQEYSTQVPFIHGPFDPSGLY
jgi:RHS repeat-associated protein